MAELLANKDFVWWAMALIVLGLSQLLKLPIKALTKKCVKDASVRARVNTTLMLIPLCLGIILNWLFCVLYLQVPYDIIEGIKVGGTAVTIYGVIEKLIKGSQSKETTETLQLVTNITNDGKVDKTDSSAVVDFINDLNKIK